MNKPELTHYRADQLFVALEAGRRFLVGGVKPLTKWESREMLDGDYEYSFYSDMGIFTGRADMFIGCTEFAVPVLHTNGSDADELLDDTTECVSRMASLMSIMRASGPHPRDYYVRGEGAYELASAQHDSRIQRLQAVFTELQYLAEFICEAKDRREELRNNR